MRKITKQSRIVLVELPPTQFGIYNGDPGYDVYSRTNLPARALHSLQAILIRDGWQNVQPINPLYHGKNKRLTEENERAIFSSDILGVSSITRTSPQTIELIKKYKSANPDGIVIAGGFDPSFRKEEWLKAGADFVVIGEGEITLSQLTERLTYEKAQFNDIAGLAFKKGKEIVITKPRRLLAPDELGNLPLPFYDKQTRAKIFATVMETTRGCPNACDFCTVTKFYGRMYRQKPLDYVIKGLKDIKNMGKLVFFTDDNFAANPERTIELCERIAKGGLYRRKSFAQVTVKIADNPELLKALKKAGIDILCVGIESINEDTLRYYKKPYSAQQNKENIQTLRKAGFWIHGMMMVGGDGDTPKSLKEDFEWMKRNLDSVQLFAPSPFPGSDFSKRMKDEGRIITNDFSLYDAQNVVIRPKNFSAFELQKAINKMYEEFYSFRESFRRWKTSPLKDVTFALYVYTHLLGGIKKTLYSPQSIKHLEFLKGLN